MVVSVKKLAALSVAAMTLAACATSSDGTTGRRFDPGASQDVSCEIALPEFLQLAETVTGKMLASPEVANWGTSRPRLVVGDVINNSYNDNIRVIDIYNRIEETILQSQLARVVDRSATAFDYVINPELTSSQTLGSASARVELVTYTFSMVMSKVDGERVGRWSGDFACRQ